MAMWQEYLIPESLAEALRQLAERGASARVVAGGTDLILEMQQGRVPALPATLVDVTFLPGFDGMEETGEWVRIGAAVTHAQIESSPLLRAHAPALVEACRVVGGPQVRNVATLGGNVAHALPAADGTIGLLALDAQALVATWAPEQTGQVREEWRPLLALFAGPGRNTLTPGQVIAAFRVPVRAPRTGSAFERIMRPQGVALPILGVAARLQLDETGRRVRQATIAVGPAGPIPFRAMGAEAALCAAADAFAAAAMESTLAAARAETTFRSSRHRAGSAYRDEMLDVLLRRVLARALERAAAG